jgi:hypothetical protein
MAGYIYIYIFGFLLTRAIILAFLSISNSNIPPQSDIMVPIYTIQVPKKFIKAMFPIKIVCSTVSLLFFQININPGLSSVHT